jgi:hypothetical protein
MISALDLARGEDELDELGVLFVVGRDRFGHIAQARIDIGKVLRIRNEEIDILAVAVVEAKHQHGAAAKRPCAALAYAFQMLHERERMQEQFRPRAGSGQVDCAHSKISRWICIRCARIRMFFQMSARLAFDSA